MPVQMKSAEEAAHRANIDLLLVESLAVLELEGVENVHILTEWDFRHIEQDQNVFLSTDGKTAYSFTGRADYVYIQTKSVLRFGRADDPTFFSAELDFRVVIIEAKTDNALNDSLIQAVVEALLADLATTTNSTEKYKGQIRFIVASANQTYFGVIDMNTNTYYCSEAIKVDHKPLGPQSNFDDNCMSRLIVLTYVKDWLHKYSDDNSALYSQFIRPMT